MSKKKRHHSCLECRLTYLVPGSHAGLQVLHLVADLYNDPRALVACTLRTKDGHLWQRPVIQHKVKVAVADSCGIELDQDIGWACIRLSTAHRTHHVLLLSPRDVPGSGTGTCWTSTRKSGPSSTTTPPLHVAGISKCCTLSAAMLMRRAESRDVSKEAGQEGYPCDLRSTLYLPIYTSVYRPTITS